MISPVWRHLLGAAVTALALAACGGSGNTTPAQSGDVETPGDTENPPPEPPNEGVITAQELLHVVERSGLESLPTDPAAALVSILTYPGGLGDVIAMHLGRYYPTPDELTPGVGPLTDLLQARANLLLSGNQAQRNIEDAMDAEVAVLMLPVDATTVIVILPTKVVENDPAAAPLPEAKEDLSQLTYEINGHTRTIEQYMQSGSTNAIALAHNGQFIYEAYQNGFNANTRHHMWSVTKSVTTSLVGIAVGEGLVNIHDPIKTYIPEAEGTVWEDTTVEDILQMESGTFWIDVPVHQPEELVLMGADFHSNGLYGMTRDEYLLRLTRVAPPGEFYRYNSGDAQMMAWLLENVYQKPYWQILSEKIWRPAGMQHDALVMHDRLENTFASMGLMATARDMLRFGELHRNGGRSTDGRQIIPADWVRMSHNYDKETGGGPRGYMWPWWGENVEAGNYTAEGYGHQLVMVSPSLHMVGVRFGNDPVDSIAQKEWEAVLTAVGNYLEGGGVK